jgi:mannose-1-phosphate guanylyltransferase
MIVVAADHHVGDENLFREMLGIAARTAFEKDCLVTLGIPPTRPETGYGYLECDRPFSEIPKGESVRLQAFREKPDAKTAAEYLAGGRHLWNMGNFVWRCEVILKAFEDDLPELLIRARDSAERFLNGEREALDRFYLDLPKELCESIDFGIMEKADHIEAIPCPVPWDDVGSWSVLRRLRTEEVDANGNLSLVRHLSLGSRNILVTGEESPEGIVVTLGVENLIIVREGEKILIAAEDQIDRMREVVGALKERGWENFL